MIIKWKVFFMLIFVSSFTTVNACGPLQPGQERAINFIVTDFKLPAVMAYSADPPAKTKVPTISTSKSEAETFVRSLIMRAVEDVLYQQGRSALLPDNVISSILQQLEVQVNYEPLDCIRVIDTTGPNQNAVGMDMINCIITNGIVTNTCSDAAADPAKCKNAMTVMNLKSIDSKFLSISGSLKTRNAIMANWSNQMWESILNRVLRTITSGPYGSNFFGAAVKIQ